MLLQISEPGTLSSAKPALENDIAVGIDLGTTFSVVAVARAGKVEVLPLALDAIAKSPAHETSSRPGLVPSAVTVTAGGEFRVGHAALAQRENSSALVTSIKRWMGHGVDDLSSRAAAVAQSGLQLQANAAGELVVQVGPLSLRPLEISAEILRHVRVQAERHLGHPVRRAVLTVPAYFDDAARAATRDAARLAGIEVLRLLNEPTAAAVAYGLDEQAEGLYAVYDLGGGTFDVSLLQLNKGVFQVLATGGDTALGGDDIDHALLDFVLAQAGVLDLTLAQCQRLLPQVRAAKEALATQATVEFQFPEGIANGQAIILTQDHLAQVAAPWVEKTLGCCRKVLADAKVTLMQIRGVVLVGGSTRLLSVRQAIKTFFGQAPLTTLDPDEAVARGAALQAAALTAGSSTLLLDVTPLTLGIELLGGVVDKVIPRNTPIPTVQRQIFTTFQNGQTALSIHIVQGEREIAALCRSLAKFELRGIPPMPAGLARIEVTSTIDADGLLTVEARELTTGVRQMVAVKPSYGLTDADMITLLEEAVQNHHDDMHLRQSIAMRVRGMRLLIAVGEALADDGDLLGHSERARIDDAIDQVNRALQKDETEITELAILALEAATATFAELRVRKALQQAQAEIGGALSKADAAALPAPSSLDQPLDEQITTEEPEKVARPLDPASQMRHSQPSFKRS